MLIAIQKWGTLPGVVIVFPRKNINLCFIDKAAAHQTGQICDNWTEYSESFSSSILRQFVNYFIEIFMVSVFPLIVC